MSKYLKKIYILYKYIPGKLHLNSRMHISGNIKFGSFLIYSRTLQILRGFYLDYFSFYIMVKTPEQVTFFKKVRIVPA